MSFLFNRITTLRVFDEGDDTGFLFNNDFRIKFSIEKTSEINANVGKISIYNLKNSSIGLLENNSARAVLESGYRGIPRSIGVNGSDTFIFENPIIEILATGNIDKVATNRVGSDTITTFEIRDGGENLQSATLEQSFPPGSTTTQIINALSGALGTTRGVFRGIQEQVFSNGVSISGRIRDTLEDITSKINTEFSVQDNELQIIPVGGNTGESAIEVQPETGLIGSPVRVVNNTNGEPGGVEFTTLLNPAYRPGRIVQLTSQFITGTFTVQKVTFTGDNQLGSENIAKVQAK